MLFSSPFLDKGKKKRYTDTVKCCDRNGCKSNEIEERGETMPSIMRSVNIISRCGAMYRADKMPNTEISACHHMYVLSICRHPGISQEQLARHICLNKSNVTRSLATLEENGFVERRQSDADKRVTLVYPTKKMLALYPKVKEIADSWNEYLSADLTEEERELFQKTLEKISKRAQTYIDSGDAPSPLTFRKDISPE